MTRNNNNNLNNLHSGATLSPIDKTLVSSIYPKGGNTISEKISKVFEEKRKRSLKKN